MSKKSSTFAAVFEKRYFFMADNFTEKILTAASDKMRQVGIRSVSIDDICRDLGMSKKTFYVYFQTKESLVDALLRRREQQLVVDVERKTKGKSVLDLLFDLIKMFKNMQDVRQVPALLYDLKKYYPQQLEAHLQRLKMLNRDLVARFLQQGIDEHLFRADIQVEPTARVLASLHQIMIDKMATSEKHPNIIADSKVAIDIFFRGLISEEGEQQMAQRIKNGK